jgi:hypothetical protein
MASRSQHPVNASPPFHALAEIISPLRLGTYLNAAGHDVERALQMYLWNAKIGEAFHIPVQAVEVGLRNRVSDGLAVAFGSEWWRESAFLDTVQAKRIDDIELVRKRLISKRKPIVTGQMIAGLSFGFWVAMLGARYYPSIWSRQLRPAFPHLPTGVNLQTLHQEVQAIADFRNRIWHHEPIFRRDLSTDFARCMKVLNWLCPTKAGWIKQHCRVSKLLREKP